jgi:hypothetical protein
MAATHLEKRFHGIKMKKTYADTTASPAPTIRQTNNKQLLL